MVFLPSTRCHWWFVLFYKKATKMVDYQMNLENWLQDASLFRNEPVDYPINFDDLLSNEKANTEGSRAILGLSDLGWLDEKVDLTILESPNSLLDHPNETEALMDDDAANFLDFLDGSFNPSYLSSDPFKNAGIYLTDCLNSPNYNEPASSEILDTHLASPGCTTLQVNSPIFLPAQSPVSPYSDILDAPEDTSSSVLQSADTSSVTSDGINNIFDSPEIHLTILDNVSSPSSSSDEALSTVEVSNSVRKRKCVNSEEDTPKVKVILQELPKSTGRKPRDRRERKKVQNKEAAARYRIKKRMEEEELSYEVSGLESTQKELNKKHDELQSEIKYLKSLMCEILQKKGIMK